MKLKNKLTGEINIVKVDEDYFNIHKDDGEFVCPVTLKELNAGWEDYYEVPKTHWSINQFGDVIDEVDGYMSETIDEMKEIGNYFDTREEAEKAVEKLKAVKRLKDKGFRFNSWTIPDEPKTPHIKLVIEAEMDVPDSPYNEIINKER